MTKRYFNSVDAVSVYASNFPANSFRIEPTPAICECKGFRCAFEIADRQDNDIIETLVICPVCANSHKTRQ